MKNCSTLPINTSCGRERTMRTSSNRNISPMPSITMPSIQLIHDALMIFPTSGNIIEKTPASSIITAIHRFMKFTTFTFHISHFTFHVSH